MTEFWESRDEAEPRRAELPHNRVVTSDDQHELSRKLDLINRRIEKLYRLVVVGGAIWALHAMETVLREQWNFSDALNWIIPLVVIALIVTWLERDFRRN